MPFEAAVTEAGVLAVMTGYNRINGPFAADSEPMLRGVLRGEWGFDGLVMSDWFGLHSTVEALAAGLDLEMPGPTRFRGQALLDAVERGDVTVEHVRGAALQRAHPDGPGRRALAATGPGPELTRDDPDDRALIRAGRRQRDGAAAQRCRTPTGTPMLAAHDGRVRRVAVIGPNAAIGQIMGGGSAHVTPTARRSIRSRRSSSGCDRTASRSAHAVGCIINRTAARRSTSTCAVR